MGTIIILGFLLGVPLLLWIIGAFRGNQDLAKLFKIVFIFFLVIVGFFSYLFLFGDI